MDFAYSQEQEDFRDGIRSFLAKRLPHQQLPELIEGEQIRSGALWSEMATQLGLQGLQIPEVFGGSEYGPVELVLVMEECGYALLPGPLLGTIGLAVPVLLASDDQQASKILLPDIATGALAGAVATGGGDCLAREDSGNWSVTGETPAILSAEEADVVIVIAADDDGPSLFAVRTADDGVHTEVLETLDLTRRHARLRLAEAHAERVGEPGAASRIMADAMLHAAVAQAGEQVGGAQRCLDIAAEYAKEREQFGRPIGSFQAVKHRCAEMMIAVESARTAAWYAAWALGQGDQGAESAVSVAKATASETYTFAARACIAVLGGIGYTWEHPAQLHLRRATSTEQMLGTPAEHFARVADALLAGVQTTDPGREPAGSNGSLAGSTESITPWRV